jgi:hypothetical protein
MLPFFVVLPILPIPPVPPSRRRAPKGRVERRYIFCATFLRVAPTGCYPAHCPAEFGLSSESPESDYATVKLTAILGIVLAIGLLGDLILLEFLVQIAARRVDGLRGLRDVPAILAQLADEEGAFGVVFELAQRPGLRSIL